MAYSKLKLQVTNWQFSDNNIYTTPKLTFPIENKKTHRILK